MLRWRVMSTSGIGSSSGVPGFDVLFPSGVPTTNATYATVPSTPTTTTPTTTSSTSATGQNPYQQAVSTLEEWQYQTLTQSLTGDTSDATAALYASAGLNADQFAELATELQNLGAAAPAGSAVDTSA